MANVTVVRTATSSQIGSLLTQASASATYLTQVSASTTYLTQASASSTYAPKASPIFTGIATNPTVPAFSVYVISLTTQSGNLTYNATNINNGSYINLGTGLFTAPVAGLYHFNYYGFVEQGVTGNTTIVFQKNGAQVPSRAYNDFNDSSYGPVINISTVISLAVNDNVRVLITGAGMHGNENSFFSGFLIG
jgi:hypothetical protein